MLRVSNQSIEIPGSTQVTDEYPCSDRFPNSHNAANYYDWCVAECKRMGVEYFVAEDTVTQVYEDETSELIKVCHIWRNSRV